MISRIDQLLDVAAAIGRGEIPGYQHNECFTSGAFDLLLMGLKDGEAFELLSEVCRRFPSGETAPLSLRGYYSLLSDLARLTHTTEMPTGLRSIIVACPQFSQGLREWYRIED